MTASRVGRGTLLGVVLIFSFLLSGGPAASESTQGVQVEINPKNPLWLRVTVRSLARTQVTLDRDRLPWGSKQRIILIAVKPNGQPLEEDPSFDDPGFEKVSIAPGVTVNGDINLGEFFKDLDSGVKKSDINLFWAYEAPAELHIAHRSGGWILIPQQK